MNNIVAAVCMKIDSVALTLNFNNRVYLIGDIIVECTLNLSYVKNLYITCIRSFTYFISTKEKFGYMRDGMG